MIIKILSTFKLKALKNTHASLLLILYEKKKKYFESLAVATFFFPLFAVSFTRKFRMRSLRPNIISIEIFIYSGEKCVFFFLFMLEYWSVKLLMTMIWWKVAVMSLRIVHMKILSHFKRNLFFISVVNWHRTKLFIWFAHKTD